MHVLTSFANLIYENIIIFIFMNKVDHIFIYLIAIGVYCELSCFYSLPIFYVGYQSFLLQACCRY